MCSILNYYWPEAKVRIVMFLLLTFVCLTLSWWWWLDLLSFYVIRVQFVLQEFKGEKKISSESEYASIARELSHLLRAEIKESFKEINGTLKVA